MEAYAGKLSEGVQALMKKYPTFRIDVYPTHRSVGFPEWVLEGTKKAAAKATATGDGLSVKDTQGGLPFPIPKFGYEAMWNHLLTYIANPALAGETWYVDSNGRPVMGEKGITYYDRSEQWDPRFKGKNDYYYSLRRYYLDEDSWLILAADKYDLKGKLFRVGFAYLTQSYDVKAPNHQFYGFYDLDAQMYSASLWPGKRGKLTYFETPDPREFSPEALAGGGVR